MMRRILAIFMGMAAPLASAGDLPAPLVRLSDLAPGIAQDIRYARAFNFTGAPVPGYDAAECILTQTTARALIRVEARLAQIGYGLVVFDCYRPARSVRFFAEWAADPDIRPDAMVQRIFFPGLARQDLIPLGYIARQSGHSIGHTVDVGLRLSSQPVPRPEFSDATDCTAPFDQRHSDSGLDMGTAFDCFSPRSGNDADIPDMARENRTRLARAMEAEGFVPYAAEWWHFRNAADPASTRQDFPVR